MKTIKNTLVISTLVAAVSLAPALSAKSVQEAHKEAEAIAWELKNRKNQTKGGGGQSTSTQQPNGNGWHLPDQNPQPSYGGTSPGGSSLGVNGQHPQGDVGDYASGANNPNYQDAEGNPVYGADDYYDAYGNYGNNPNWSEEEIEAESKRRAKEETEGMGTPSMQFAFCLFMTATVSPHKIAKNKGCLDAIKSTCSMKRGYPHPPKCAIFPVWAF